MLLFLFSACSAQIEKDHGKISLALGDQDKIAYL